MVEFKITRVGSVAKVEHPNYDIVICGTSVTIQYNMKEELTEDEIAAPFNIVDKLFKIMQSDPESISVFEDESDFLNN